jgi:hypothetical protein
MARHQGRLEEFESKTHNSEDLDNWVNRYKKEDVLRALAPQLKPKPLKDYGCRLTMHGEPSEVLAEDRVIAASRAEAREIMIDRHWDDRLIGMTRPCVSFFSERKAPSKT